MSEVTSVYFWTVFCFQMFKWQSLETEPHCILQDAVELGPSCFYLLNIRITVM